MDVSAIKLIIWDLDDTFWRGTLSEGGVEPIGPCVDLVVTAAKKGVVSAICSKNDLEPCKKRLTELGVWDYFVFPSINWEPKGQRIKTLISDMNLRSANVLFLDDNPQNLEEAKYYCGELMTASPEEIPRLYEEISRLDKSDEGLSRLNSYKVLEKKNKIRTSMSSNEEFLYQSNIHVDFHTDCKENTDRIYELLMRSNQLNFTKIRSSKDELTALFEDKAAECGYVTAYDNYGDYGIVGFYAVKDGRVIHLFFSCRTLGMGLEQYTYERLGFPELSVVGDVSVKIGRNEPPATWINQDAAGADNEFDSVTNADFRALIKGPCDLNQIFSFIKNEDMFDCEFTYVSGEKQSRGVVIEGMNHTAQIVQAYSITAEQKAAACSLPFGESGMYSDKIYKNNYGMIFLSILTDANLGIYRNRENGAVVAFGEYLYPLTDKNMWSKYLNNEVYTANCAFSESVLRKIEDEYEFLGRLSPAETAENLRFIYEHIRPGARLVILLGCEREYRHNRLSAWENRHIDHKRLNAAVREEFRDCSGVTLFDVNRYITSDDDFADSINHYKKRVYYLMAKELTEMINALAKTDAARRTSKIKLAYLTLKQVIKKLIKPYG